MGAHLEWFPVGQVRHSHWRRADSIDEGKLEATSSWLRAVEAVSLVEQWNG